MTTDAETAALMAFLGADSSGAPRGTSSSGNLNLYQDIISMVGNPLFLYQQGIINADTVLEMVRGATREPIDTAALDYVSMEKFAEARQDPLAMRGFELIKNGATVEQVLREIVGTGATAAGKMSDKLNSDLRYLENDLVRYESRWLAAQDVLEKLSTGEYTEIDGQVFKPKPLDEAMAATKALGLPTALQNPAMWEIIPDAKLLADAAVGEQQAVSLTNELNRLIKESTTAATKSSTDVYKQMLANPDVKRIYEEARMRDQQKVGGFVATRMAQQGEAKPAVTQKPAGGFAATRGVPAGRPVVKGATAPVAGFAATRGMQQKPMPKPDEAAAQYSDYWAKLGASYAGRGEQEQRRKPIESLSGRVQAATERVAQQKKAAFCRRLWLLRLLFRSLHQRRVGPLLVC
jgi:hypothetical protein